MIKLRSLASGSNGNVCFLSSGDTNVLVDAGISCKRISELLLDTGCSPDKLSAVCITHEHSDHIQGLKILMKKYRVPVYATEGTVNALLKQDRLHEYVEALFRPFPAGSEFRIGHLSVETLPVSHDAADPVAYRFTDDNGVSAAVMTDLGCFTESTEHFLKGVNGLLLEANHDIRMLEAGHYPFPLKRRILSASGHLANEKTGELLLKVLHPGLHLILLGHLSEENNYPDIALMTVRNMIDASELPYRANDFVIGAATREAPSGIYMIEK